MSELASKAKSAFRRGFGAVIEIAPSGGASFFVDGRGESCVIAETAPEDPAQCLWRASDETLLRIFEGGRALESAYLSWRLQIAGDMSVMARLVLESGR